ncbi:DUF4435 domain-containing protein [Coprobacter tertius]|uniref:DUF4435 domain-containing protein n=1 Tax=Coprobacter tertius TaxID=2944915 RepID=A0ABT1MEE1_9BACT|nr:DUF4435 domain-containing protein [Coprobacter tertius]MCP9610995.1 DUF4435 domain-containing protein [Coprobacter tertius]
MNIVLPKKNQNKEEVLLQDPHNIIIIGANGTGKSRFGREIERRYSDCSFRISASDALYVNPYRKVLPHSIAELYAKVKKENAVLGKEILTEFDQLLYLLQQEEFHSLVNHKEKLKRGEDPEMPVTRLDKTQSVWESLFPHSRLLRKGGEIEIWSAGDKDPYTSYHMSQGEKVVFYLIASVLYAMPEALIIVEDPEIYLHRSILASLWDSIEQSRPDCTFIYLTHDIEFAVSRPSGIRVWVKAYDSAHCSWDYELIENHESFPEEIYLELLGSRKPILFIEGTDSTSIDIKLYPHIFPDYLVKPLGGCTKVIETTKAFGEMKNFHHLDSKGIVDRDRRTPHEIKYLRERNIYVPDVAEVENLLMLETVIRVVARRMLQDEDLVFETVKENVLELFAKDLDAQTLLHTRHRLRHKIEYMIDRRLNTIEELVEHVETLTDDIDTRKIYEDIRTDFEKYIVDRDYNAVLRVYNQKGMLPQSRITQLCGLANKEKYLSFVLSILKENKDDAVLIRQAIQKCFGIT